LTAEVLKLALFISLILADGSGMPLVLVLMAYGVDTARSLSSGSMALELMYSFVGGMTVVLCVPSASPACTELLAGIGRSAAGKDDVPDAGLA